MALVITFNDIQDPNDPRLDKRECEESHAMVQLAFDACTLVPGGAVPPRYAFDRLHYTALQVSCLRWGPTPLLDARRQRLFGVDVLILGIGDQCIQPVLAAGFALPPAHLGVNSNLLYTLCELFKFTALHVSSLRIIANADFEAAPALPAGQAGTWENNLGVCTLVEPSTLLRPYAWMMLAPGVHFLAAERNAQSAFRGLMNSIESVSEITPAGR